MGSFFLNPANYEKLPNFIAVEGPIGVGKTTLAKLISESLGNEIFLENPMENPFLEDFYSNPSGSALATQLFFLFQRAKHIQDLKQTDIFYSSKVSDYLLDKDKIFAETTLSDRELNLYLQIYDHVALDLPTPDLVIYLQAQTNTLYERIVKRGVEMEKNINFDYLESLNEAYKNFFLSFERSPVFIVNSEFIDLANNKKDYELLLEKLLTYFNNPEGRKMYFNPSPSLI